MIQLKSTREIDAMARGGAILAATLGLLERDVGQVRATSLRVLGQ